MNKCFKDESRTDTGQIYEYNENNDDYSSFFFSPYCTHYNESYHCTITFTADCTYYTRAAADAYIPIYKVGFS